MDAPKISLKNLFSFFMIRWKMSEERKKFYTSHEFYTVIAENNVQFGLVIAGIVLFIGVVGFWGASYELGEPSIIQSISSTFVYTLMIVVSIPQILFTLISLRNIRVYDPEVVLNINFLNQLINALMAGFSIFSTQVGSGLFFETVLIMLSLSSLPYWRKMRSVMVLLASIVPLLVAVVGNSIMVPWQDKYDLIIFYALCFLIMTLRRHWLQENFWLMHRAELENRSLEKESRTDELTQLGNRTGLREDFPSFANNQVVMIMMDLDNFKKYNDQYGHNFGDEVLRKTGQYIAAVFGPLGGWSYRYGGDEFLVVMQDTAIDTLEKQLELFSQNYMSLFHDGEMHTLSIGYSYGIAANESALRACLAAADESLYESKARGKNQISCRAVNVYSQGSHDNILMEEASVNYMDKLTGLLNRDGFRRKLETMQMDREWVVICFDIDRFQEINRSIGYPGGNKILMQIARLLNQYFPQSIISRYESDHFFVATRCANIERRIRRVQSEIAIVREHCYIFLRAGICSLADTLGKEDIHIIIDNAKYACDSLRNQSAHAYCFYTHMLEDRRQKSAYVLNYFSEAIDKEQIEVYLQPIIGAMSRKCCGFEALSRWYTPEGKQLAPGEYIPVLEKSYDVYKLDLYVLRRVCQYIQKMDEKRKKNLFVSFNLSRHDFQVIDIPEAVDRIVTCYQVPRHMLRVEVTESALADDENIRKDVSRLRQLGYQVWVDDFGSGISSLNVLREYDVDGAKLDMKFLKDFETSRKSPVVIQSIIQLCHVLGLEIVVEGVETQKQLDFIQKSGGHYIQGFIFSKPKPMAQIEKEWFWDNYLDQRERPLYRRAGNMDLDRLFTDHKEIQGSIPGQVGTLIFEEEGNQIHLLRHNDEMERVFHHIGEKGADMQTLLKNFTETPCMDIVNKSQATGNLEKEIIDIKQTKYFVQACVLSVFPKADKRIILVQMFSFDPCILP